MVEPPWDDESFPDERDCVRCGERIPANWRHYWPPCPCTWLLVPIEGRHSTVPDSGCPTCDGTGFGPCVPQDLSVLRRWGYCSACGAPAFVLVRAVGEVGEVPGSARHGDRERDDHEVEHVMPGPLARTLGDYLERSHG